MAGLTISHVMQAYAQDAVELARGRFSVTLDFSEQSLDRVEACLGDLYDESPTGIGRLLGARRKDSEIWELSKRWGGYVGEVVRRRWGGEWQTEDGDAGKVIGLRVLRTDVYPISKVYGRLTTGSDEDIAAYYQALRAGFAKLENAPDGDRLFEGELEEERLQRYADARRRGYRLPPPIPPR